MADLVSGVFAFCDPASFVLDLSPVLHYGKLVIGLGTRQSYDKSCRPALRSTAGHGGRRTHSMRAQPSLCMFGSFDAPTCILRWGWPLRAGNGMRHSTLLLISFHGTSLACGNDESYCGPAPRSTACHGRRRIRNTRAQPPLCNVGSVEASFAFCGGVGHGVQETVHDTACCYVHSSPRYVFVHSSAEQFLAYGSRLAMSNVASSYVLGDGARHGVLLRGSLPWYVDGLLQP